MSSHDDQVERQFGPRAQAYLASQVHAQGEDLAALARLVAGQCTLDLLDLGCGAGHLSFAVASQVRSVTALDLCSDMLAVVSAESRARGLANISVRLGVADALPFADQSFDYVCTRYSAHHWANLPAALKEMRRVLRRGGRVIIIDVIAPSNVLIDTHLQMIELLRDGSHVRDYSVCEWSTQLAAAGLALESSATWKLHLDFAAWLARMRTPSDRAAVIRAMLAGAPREVRDYLSVAADGSFDVDAAMLEATAAAR